MKSSRYKPTAPKRTSPLSGGPSSDNSFYEQGGRHAPLDGSPPSGGASVSHTSQHTAARRREESNRVPDKALLFLVIKIFMIPILLLAGYVGLKMGLGRLDGPSEQDVRAWEAKAALMDLGDESTAVRAVAASTEAEDFVVDMAFLGSRLGQWNAAEQRFRAAKALNRQGVDSETIKRLKQVLTYAPNHTGAQKLLLELYMRTGAYDDAQTLCVRLLDQDSAQQALKMTLLDALWMSEKLDAALLLAEEILETDPNNRASLEVVAYVQAALGNALEALEAYERLLDNDSEHVLALAGSAHIHQLQQEWTVAIKFYQELLRIEPTPEVYHALAQCYARLGEGGKSTIFMGQAVSLYGESAVSPWLKEDDFDAVRESVEFRSFADQVVGTENRKAIEDLRHRKLEEDKSLVPSGIDMPAKPDLQLLRPGQ